MGSLKKSKKFPLLERHKAVQCCMRTWGNVLSLCWGVNLNSNNGYFDDVANEIFALNLCDELIRATQFFAIFFFYFYDDSVVFMLLIWP